jgi:hypothetical protein
MSRIVLGIICGLVFGAIDIGIMLPMSFPDKKAAIPAAFVWDELRRENFAKYGFRAAYDEQPRSGN